MHEYTFLLEFLNICILNIILIYYIKLLKIMFDFY